MIPRQFRDGEFRIGGGRIAQPVSEFREPDAEGRHGVAEIVQDSLGQFSKSGLERLVDELAAGVRHAFDHAVELASPAWQSHPVP